MTVTLWFTPATASAIRTPESKSLSGDRSVPNSNCTPDLMTFVLGRNSPHWHRTTKEGSATNSPQSALIPRKDLPLKLRHIFPLTVVVFWWPGGTGRAQQIKVNGQKIDGKPQAVCNGRQGIGPGENTDYGIRFPQANACSMAGDLYSRAGDMGDAKNLWERGCQSGSPSGCVALAKQLINEGNKQGAIAILESPSNGCGTAPYAGVRVGDEASSCDVELYDLVKSDDIYHNTPEAIAIARRLCVGGASFGPGCFQAVPVPQPATDESIAQWKQAIEQLKAIGKQAQDANSQRQSEEMDALTNAYNQSLKANQQTLSQILSNALSQRNQIQEAANAKIGQIMASARPTPVPQRAAATASMGAPRANNVPASNAYSSSSMPGVSGDGSLTGQYRAAANAYRKAASQACTPEARNCYLSQAQYYECIVSQLTSGGGAGCNQPPACTSSGCGAGQSGNNGSGNGGGSQPLEANVPKVVIFHPGGQVEVDPQLDPTTGQPVAPPAQPTRDQSQALANSMTNAFDSMGNTPLPSPALAPVNPPPDLTPAQPLAVSMTNAFESIGNTPSDSSPAPTPTATPAPAPSLDPGKIFGEVAEYFDPTAELLAPSPLDKIEGAFESAMAYLLNLDPLERATNGLNLSKGMSKFNNEIIDQLGVKFDQFANWLMGNQ